MVTFREFVSVFADECGGGANDAAPVWNNNEETIRSLSESELREKLRCP